MLIQRQVKARRTGADVGHVIVDPGLVLEQRFEAFDLVGGVAQRSAFGQFQIDHQLQATRCREELLRHKAEQHDGANEQQHGRQDHGFAPAHAPLHQTPDALIKRRGIRIGLAGTVFGGMNLRQVRQEFFPEVRHEHHRGHPRRQQRDGDHLEDRTGVFASARLRRGNRQEAGRGDQRTGEHRERGTGPGITRRFDPVEALLHFDRHHFHGDDRVVHQQTQG
ncbi:hypothetical protein D3C87_1285110 [compost metagenome]